MTEAWKDIAGYEGRYQVSNAGRVKALSFMQRYLLRNGREAFRRTKERIVAVQRINSGYLVAHLHFDNRRRAHLVHRLVAEAFACKSANLEVNHRNGDKGDNRAENLEWLTRKANHLHAINIGLRKNAKPVRDPESGAEYPSVNAAARALRKSPRTIRSTFERAVR